MYSLFENDRNERKRGRGWPIFKKNPFYLPGFRVQPDKAKYWFVTNVSNIFCISQKMSFLGQQVPAGIHAYDNDAPYLQKTFHDFAKAETFWIRLRIRSICV